MPLIWRGFRRFITATIPTIIQLVCIWRFDPNKSAFARQMIDGKYVEAIPAFHTLRCFSYTSASRRRPASSWNVSLRRRPFVASVSFCSD
jgi:hypothetical protein